MTVRIFSNLYTSLKLLIKHIIRKLLQKTVFRYQNELQGMKDNKVMHVNIKYVLMGNTLALKKENMLILENLRSIRQ